MLLNAASRFARVFQLAAPDAPGLVAFGAEFDPAIADPMHAGSPPVGSAAGTSWDAAALHGMLELIERDAAGRWWRGGDRGVSIPPQHEAHLMAAELLPQLRQNAAGRRSWFLDKKTDIGVPCVAAVSCSANGSGFAFGLAARPTLKAAARSAIFEMCQLELALAVVKAKRRESGEAALN